MERLPGPEAGDGARPVLWGLMQGLYYPAVLGTGIWFLVQKVVIAPSGVDMISDLSNYFGLLLLVYFSLSFSINQHIRPDHYKVTSFMLDLVIIVVLFIAFYHLGLFKPNGPQPADYRWFYLTLIPIPVLQQLWNHSVGHKDKRLWLLTGTGVGVLLLGGLAGYSYVWANIAILVCVAGLLVAYGVVVTLHPFAHLLAAPAVARNQGFHVLDEFVCEAIHAPSVPLANPANQGRNEGMSVVQELVVRLGTQTAESEEEDA
jgi:hypothetical protein